jgi:RNA polymerase sigma factor (sigma-70 family)
MSRTSKVIPHLRRAVLLHEGARLTDGELLGCFIEHRDQAAFAALVRRHGPMVWGVCRRLLSHHDAEDAFQATFLVLVRKAASVRPREMVANWLYGVAHQTALQARRTSTRRRARERQAADMREPAVTEQDLWRDLQPLLDETLSRLPDKYRAVIVLCDLEGKTRKEAARQLGCPEGTVAGRLARARVMLAKRLARHGLAVSGGALAAVLSHKGASASVPPSVVSSTIKAASLFAAGQSAATGAISVKAAALAEGVMRTTMLTKLRTVLVMAALVLSLCGIAGAAVGMGHDDQGSGKKAQPKAKKAKSGTITEEKLREKLQGTWTCLYHHENGVKSKPGGSLVFQGNTWKSLLADGKVSQAGTFRIVDATSSPRKIDLWVTHSSVKEEEGRFCKAIILVDGDTLLYGASAGERPEGFVTEEGDGGNTAGMYKRGGAKEAEDQER